MIRPDAEGHSFKARWEALWRVLLVESSTKLVALTVGGYADFQDGSSCRPSNERICRNTGLSERTVRSAWTIMRELDMAERVEHGVPHLRRADEYRLQVPESWKGLPLLGPRERQFTCVYCGDGFNPPPLTAAVKPGSVTWLLWRACFCPSPGKQKKETGFQAGCCGAWNRDQKRSGGKLPWGSPDAWKVFYEARNDDW